MHFISFFFFFPESEEYQGVRPTKSFFLNTQRSTEMAKLPETKKDGDHGTHHAKKWYPRLFGPK